MARTKRILSYETPPSRRPALPRATDDDPDEPTGADPLAWWTLGVCLVTLGCIAGVFVMGPVSALDPPAWEMLQDVLVAVGSAGMVVTAVMSLLTGGSRRR